jgi:hypothetical protein
MVGQNKIQRYGNDEADAVLQAMHQPWDQDLDLLDEGRETQYAEGALNCAKTDYGEADHEEAQQQWVEVAVRTGQ